MIGNKGKLHHEVNVIERKARKFTSIYCGLAFELKLVSLKQATTRQKMICNVYTHPALLKLYIYTKGKMKLLVPS